MRPTFKSAVNSAVSKCRVRYALCILSFRHFSSPPLQSKLYKLFAKQLEVKHRALENVKTREDRIAMEKELDGFLNTRIFLGVSGINILDVEVS